MKITSLTNERIKQVVKLRQPRPRQESGLTVVEGRREVSQALKAGVKIKEVFICPPQLNDPDGQKLYEQLQKKGIQIEEVTPEVFDKISFGDRQEGVLAVACFTLPSLAQLNLPADPLVVVLDHVEKPGNLGAILRTCDAGGVDALIIVDPATDIYNPNVIRASLGAVFTVPLAQGTVATVVDFLQKKNIQLIAAAVDSRTPYTEADFKKGCALVLGSEEKGLSDFWKKAAAEQVHIPMRGKIDSLNVSVSAAILIYEARRQRGMP